MPALEPGSQEDVSESLEPERPVTLVASVRLILVLLARVTFE